MKIQVSGGESCECEGNVQGCMCKKLVKDYWV